MSDVATTRGGTGEPMVLLHGIGSNRQVWELMRPALERHHDVLALDLPGFGESPPLDGPRNSVGLADAVEAEMKSAGWKRAHIVGNSMGGWIALELASRGRAESAVAISPVGGANEGEERWSKRILKAHRICARLGTKLPEIAQRALMRPAWLRQQLLGMQMTRARDIDPARLVHATRSLAEAPGFDELLEDIDSDANLIENNRERFGAIDAPVLILWGDKDKILTPRGGPRMRDAIPGSQLREVPSLGHVPMLDHPELCAREVLRFTAGAVTAGTAPAPA